MKLHFLNFLNNLEGNIPNFGESFLLPNSSKVFKVFSLSGRVAILVDVPIKDLVDPFNDLRTVILLDGCAIHALARKGQDLLEGDLHNVI